MKQENVMACIRMAGGAFFTVVQGTYLPADTWGWYAPNGWKTMLVFRRNRLNRFSCLMPGEERFRPHHSGFAAALPGLSERGMVHSHLRLYRKVVWLGRPQEVFHLYRGNDMVVAHDTQEESARAIASLCKQAWTDPNALGILHDWVEEHGESRPCGHPGAGRNVWEMKPSCLYA